MQNFIYCISSSLPNTVQKLIKKPISHILKKGINGASLWSFDIYDKWFWKIISGKLIKSSSLEVDKIHAFVNQYWIFSISQRSRFRGRKYSMEQYIHNYCRDTIWYWYPLITSAAWFDFLKNAKFYISIIANSFTNFFHKDSITWEK